MKSLHEHLRDTSSYTPTVVGFPRREQELLLGLRKKVSHGLGLNLISGIGGKVGDEAEFAHETHEEGLKREFMEEVVVDVHDIQHRGNITFLFPHKVQWNSKMKIYSILSWTNEPQETDVIAPQWHSLDHLPFEQMWDDYRLWLPQVLQGKFVEGAVLYDENLKVIEHTLKFV